MELKQESLNSISGEIINLLIKKNRDYGNSYFKLREEFGRVAFVVRLADKIERLKTLLKNEPQVMDEREEDTIKDIIGYCLLELYFRQDEGRK